MKLIDILLEAMNDQEIEIFKDEAFKTFPNIKLKPNAFNKFGYPVFILDDKEIETANIRKMIKVKKIDTILKWFIDKGYAKNVKYSKSTSSVYFTYNGHKVRLSDHENPWKEFNGINLPIRWNSNINDSIRYILTSV